MPYFDSTNATHRNLLPPDIRDDAELENIAAIVEADVIAHYTEHVPTSTFKARDEYLRDGIVSLDVQGVDVSNQAAPAGAVVPQLAVYLRGYKVDPDDATVDPGLKLALRRTIAEVIRWRHGVWKREQAVDSASDGGGKSRAFRPYSDAMFPPDWDRWLAPYHSNDPLWNL